MCSIHANHARDALAKLSTLPLLAGRNIDAAFVVPTVASAIDVVVHAELERGGRRRVVEVVAPTGRVVSGIPEATTLFELSGGTLSATGAVPERAAKFRRAGIDPALILRGPARSDP
jgi:pilus assembly protein CpaF